MTILIRRSFALPALMIAGISCAALMTPHTAQAGLLGKLKKKVDSATGKAEKPVEQAQQKTDEAVGRVVAPVDQAQQRLDQGVGRATAPMGRAQGQIGGVIGSATSPVTRVTGRLNNGLNRTTNRVMQPAARARQGVYGATNRATQPVRRAQGQMQNATNRATQPVRQVQGHMANAQGQLNALRMQAANAERLTDTSLRRDPALARYALDAVTSKDAKVLRLTGTVRDAAEKARAGRLAQRHFKAIIQNDIRIQR